MKTSPLDCGSNGAPRTPCLLRASLVCYSTIFINCTSHISTYEGDVPSTSQWRDHESTTVLARRPMPPRSVRSGSLLPAHKFVGRQRAKHHRTADEHCLARHLTGAHPNEQYAEEHLERGKKRDLGGLQHTGT